ncbi:unnamed protein product [Choristocarpus tenellus]
MFFRMDKAQLRAGFPDCEGESCYCVNDTQKVTVINPPFMKLMQQYTPVGLLSTLSQEVFSKIKEGITTGFVRATKAYLLPNILTDIYYFRKAFHVSDTILRSLLHEIVVSNGTSAAVAALRGSYHDTSVNCLGFEPSGYGTCPWGLLSYIESAASSLGVNGTISEAEAEYLLGLRLPSNASILDRESGIQMWVSAGRFSGNLNVPSMPLPSEVDPSGKQAFSVLVETMCEWELAAGGTAPSTLECEAKVTGTLEWLYGVWYTETKSLDSLVLDEWRGSSNTSRNITCDAIGTICSWSLANNTQGEALNISATSAKRMIDPSEEDPRNYLSMYTTTGQTLWSRAYIYCTSNSSNMGCDEANDIVEAATETLPGSLSDADGNSGVCTIATYIFHKWVADSDMMNQATVKFLNSSVFEQTGFRLSGDNIEDIGYWTTGAVTNALLGLETLGTISQDGIWDFMDEDYHSLGPEIWAQVAQSGYTGMKNLSVGAGKILLDMLANDSISGDNFRKLVLGQSTTYYGDSDEWWVEGSSSTQLFDDDDVLFVEENPYADFSQAIQGSNNDLEEMRTWLDTQFMSSSDQCYILEGFYEDCLELVSEGDDWATSCDFFRTILSNTVTGIECDDTRIYDNVHPYPKKPGNMLASFMYSLVWEQVLKKEYLVCDDPANCNFSKGGFFTTQRARDVIFGGYAEGLTIKLMNKTLAKRNLTIECSQSKVLSQSKTCEPTYDGDCTEHGFKVKHAEHGLVLEVNNSDLGQHLWHSPRITLPYDLGVIDNPVFAIYPGGTWANESFQKEKDCEKRVLHGEAGLWKNCETTVNTGRADYNHIGNIIEYYGNSSLLTGIASGAVIDVYGSDGTQLMPYQWEGFDKYSLVYLMRMRGNDYLGNSTVVMLEGESLLQFHMVRDSESTVLRYPTVYEVDDNSTATISIRLNRYIAQTQATPHILKMNLYPFIHWQGWLDARDRVGDTMLTDFNGMPYTVPRGMVSTQVLTGYATFISDPHFYANDLLSGDASTQVRNIDPTSTSHQSHVDVDPVTGKVLRRAIRLQINFRMERSAYSPELLSSKSSATVCTNPTKDTLEDGYGCFMFVPILWYDDQRVMDEDSALWLYEEFLVFEKSALETASYGLVGTVILFSFGSLLQGVFSILKRKFDRKRFID